MDTGNIDQSQQRNMAVGSGALFVALFGVGFVVSNFIASQWYSSPFVDESRITQYFLDNSAEERFLSLIHAVASVSLVVFVACVAAFVRRHADDAGVLPWISLAGGILSSASLLLAALCEWLLSREHIYSDQGLLRLVHDLTYASGGPAHVLALAPVVGAASMAARRRQILPPWITTLGIATAALSLVSVVALVWEPATYMLPIIRTTSFIWIGAVSVVLIRSRSFRVAR